MSESGYIRGIRFINSGWSRGPQIRVCCGNLPGVEGANFVCLFYHHACPVCAIFQVHVAGIEGPLVICKQKLFLISLNTFSTFWLLNT